MSKYDRWLIRRIIDWVQREDDRNRRAKISKAMRERQDQGQRVSRFAPYGWQLDPNDETRLVENAREQLIRIRIRDEHEAGKSQRAIARDLTREGVPCRNAKQWTHQAIHRVVERADGQTSAGKKVATSTYFHLGNLLPR